jgi:hypothetical protein
MTFYSHLLDFKFNVELLFKGSQTKRNLVPISESSAIAFAAISFHIGGQGGGACGENTESICQNLQDGCRPPTPHTGCPKSELDMKNTPSPNTLLGAKKRLYKRLRWLVGWSVRPSVGGSVCPHITSKNSYIAIALIRGRGKLVMSQFLRA